MSYGSILQIMTAYYLYIKIWIFLYSILLIQLQESKNEAKMLISWKILAELSLIWCISTLYSSWTPKKLSKASKNKNKFKPPFWMVCPLLKWEIHWSERPINFWVVTLKLLLFMWGNFYLNRYYVHRHKSSNIRKKWWYPIS